MTDRERLAALLTDDLCLQIRNAWDDAYRSVLKSGFSWPAAHEAGGKAVRELLAGVTLAPRAPEPSEPSEDAIEAARNAGAIEYRNGEELPTRLRTIAMLRAAYAIDHPARAPSEAPIHPEAFGEVDDPAYRRGEIHVGDPGERYVEMACCGFRFSADHEDTDRKGYSCPMCAPSEAAPPDGPWRIQRIAIGPLQGDSEEDAWRISCGDERRTMYGATEAEAIAVRDALNRLARLG